MMGVKREIRVIEGIECLQCSKCKEWKEFNEFAKEGKYKDGTQKYKSHCKECNKEYREANKEKLSEYYKEYYKTNKKKLKEREKKYREANKEKISEYGKKYRETNKEKLSEYREANKEKINERNKEYYKANKEKIKEYYKANKEKIKECNKEYREANKEKINERNKEYYKANKEKIKECNKEYREANKEKIKEYNKKHYKISTQESLNYAKKICSQNGLINDKLKDKGLYGIIYLFQNKINKRCYVGQTITGLENRYSKDVIEGWIKDRKNCESTLLEEDIKKYGTEVFTYDIIDKGYCRFHLDKLEAYYIDKYKAFEEGYNNKRGNLTTSDGIREFKELIKEYGLEELVSKEAIEFFEKNMEEEIVCYF